MTRDIAEGAHTWVSEWMDIGVTVRVLPTSASFLNLLDLGGVARHIIEDSIRGPGPKDRS